MIFIPSLDSPFKALALDDVSTRFTFHGITSPDTAGSLPQHPGGYILAGTYLTGVGNHSSPLTSEQP